MVVLSILTQNCQMSIMTMTLNNNTWSGLDAFDIRIRTFRMMLTSGSNVKTTNKNITIIKKQSSRIRPGLLAQLQHRQHSYFSFKVSERKPEIFFPENHCKNALASTLDLTVIQLCVLRKWHSQVWNQHVATLSLSTIFFYSSFCIVCAFGSNQQLKDGLEELPDNLETSLKDTKTYMNSTIQQINNLLQVNYKEFSDVLLNLISSESSWFVLSIMTLSG